MRLGCDTKGEFQATHFGDALQAYFNGGNVRENSGNISYQIEEIMEGLSKAWDKAEEQQD